MVPYAHSVALTTNPSLHDFLYFVAFQLCLSSFIWLPSKNQPLNERVPSYYSDQDFLPHPLKQNVLYFSNMVDIIIAVFKVASFFLFFFSLVGVHKFVNFHWCTVTSLLYFWETLKLSGYDECILHNKVFWHKWDALYLTADLPNCSVEACLFGLPLNWLSLMRVWNRRFQISAQLLTHFPSTVSLSLSQFSFSFLHYKEEGLLSHRPVSGSPLGDEEERSRNCSRNFPHVG